jgi:hypothetical protein
VKLDDSIKKLSIDVDGQLLEFRTTQEKTSSKTFQLVMNCSKSGAIITSIDINRRTTNPVDCAQQLAHYDSIACVQLSELLQDYQTNFPDTSSMSEEAAAKKIKKHLLKRSMLEQISMCHDPVLDDSSLDLNQSQIHSAFEQCDYASCSRSLDFSLYDE